jgi:hypothetical protein
MSHSILYQMYLRSTVILRIPNHGLRVRFPLPALITSLRTAVDNEGTLDKEATSYADIFDAFRPALRFYKFENATE